MKQNSTVVFVPATGHNSASNTKYRRAAKQVLGAFDCATGRVRGEPLDLDPELVAAVTEWIAKNGGNARFRARHGPRGVVVELKARVTIAA